jgi:hypothetical protein
MEPQNVPEKVKIYYEHRTHANRMGLWVVLVATALLAVARSPNFAIGDPFGGIAGTFHAGYVAAYGHFIILAFIAVYRSSFLACAELNSRARHDLAHVKIPGERTNTEAFLLRPPLCSRPDWYSDDRSWFYAVFPIVFGTVIYGIFLWDYFGFHIPGRHGQRFFDLLFTNGFSAAWKRGTPSSIWINGALQSWATIIGLPVCLYYLVSTGEALNRYATSTVWLPWTGVRKWLRQRRGSADAGNLS